MTTDTASTAISTTGGASDAHTHKSDRMSARPQRIEVIMRGELRRRWSLEQKQSIVKESFAVIVLIIAIARKRGIGTGQLYGWRH
jgi:transposase